MMATAITDPIAAWARLLPYDHSPAARRPGSARSTDPTASVASPMSISASHEMGAGFGHPQTTKI